MPSLRPLAAATALVVALGLPALAAAAPASAEPTPGPVVPPGGAPSPTPTPTLLPVEPAAATVNHRGGHSAAARHLTITGTGLAGLQAVLVDGVPAPDLVVTGDTSATFLLDVAPDYQPGTVHLALRSDDGTTVPTPLTFTYKAVSGVDRELAYGFANWDATRNRRFGYIPRNDCADFVSQMLLARGWRPSAQWFDRGPAPRTGLPRASAAWIESTAMSDWLHRSRTFAQHLGYARADRDRVVVGDVVQFDWDARKHPRIWQHTAVVSKVVTLPDGQHDIYYVAHTNDRTYGGSTQWLAQHGSRYLRIQFWHLLR